MGVLRIIFIILGITALFLQYLLYQEDTKDIVYIINMVLAIIIAFIAFSSLPTNYTIQKIIVLILGLSGASSIFVKERTNQPMIPKAMLTVSIIGNIILLLV